MAGKKIDHIGVMVKDLEASLSFYKEVAGMQEKSRLVIAGGTKTLVFLGFNGSEETELELIHGSGEEYPKEGVVNHFAIAVDDIEADFVRLKNSGITLLSEDVAELHNGFRLFFVQGPDGEKVEFFQRG